MATGSSQKAYFPMKYLNVTQSYGVGTHQGSLAIDIAGKDTGIDPVYAPFDCIVKKIWDNGHTVWVESAGNVLWADGTTSKATMSFTHDNNVTNLYVGKRIPQGYHFYDEGTAGNATGNHVHMECAKGSFIGTGWFLNRFGWWTINNGVKPEQLLTLRNDTTVLNTGGIKWIKETEVKEVIGNKNHVNILFRQFFGRSAKTSEKDRFSKQTLEYLLNNGLYKHRTDLPTLLKENAALKKEVAALKAKLGEPTEAQSVLDKIKTLLGK